MPQMFPINWLILFIIFSALLLITYKKLYNSFHQPLFNPSYMLSKPSSNWLW